MTSATRPLCMALLAIAVVGCSGEKLKKPPLPGETPEETLTNFRRALWHEDYKKAYAELCVETQKRYAFGRWSLFMQKTKVGAIIDKVFIDWYLYNVRYSADQKEAFLVFGDPKDQTAFKEFKMVFEEGKWKLWFSFATLFGMPDSDETSLTPSSEEKGK